MFVYASESATGAGMSCSNKEVCDTCHECSAVCAGSPIVGEQVEEYAIRLYVTPRVALCTDLWECMHTTMP